MNSLTEIKNQYAQEQGYKTWSEIMFLNNRNPIAVENHMDEICIRAQKAALEKAAKNAKTTTAFASRITERIIVDRTSIINPENLIQ